LAPIKEKFYSCQFIPISLYRQTVLTEEEKEELKIKSITTQAKLNEFEQLNIERTIQTDLKAKKVLSEKFVKGLYLKI